MKRSAGIAAVLVLASSPLHAQVDLALQQGDAWVTSLSMPEPASIVSKWRYWGLPIQAASLQVAFTKPMPGAMGTPPVVKEVPISVPSGAGKWSFFDLTPQMIPANAPSRVYVRVQTPNAHSSWVSIFVGQRASHADAASTADVLKIDPVRKDPTPSVPSLGGAVPASKEPFVIPGGYATAATPLWITLTGIKCEEETGDGSPSDEVYVIVATVALNRADMPASHVAVRYTSVYEDFDEGDERVPNMGIWASEDEGRPIPDPRDVIIIVAALERDGVGSRELAAKMIKGLLQAKLNILSGALSHKQIYDILEETMWELMNDQLGASEASISSGDDYIGLPAELVLTQSNLELARSGTVVKVPMMRKSVSRGKYELRFQVGRQGKSSVHW